MSAAPGTAFRDQLMSKLHRVSGDPEIIREVASYRSLMSFARIALTCAIVGWGIFLSVEYRKATKKEEIDSWEYVNKLWLGTNPSGLLFLTFKVWITTVAMSAGIAILNRLTLI